MLHSAVVDPPRCSQERAALPSAKITVKAAGFSWGQDYEVEQWDAAAKAAAEGAPAVMDGQRGRWQMPRAVDVCDACRRRAHDDHPAASPPEKGQYHAIAPLTHLHPHAQLYVQLLHFACAPRHQRAPEHTVVW